MGVGSRAGEGTMSRDSVLTMIITIACFGLIAMVAYSKRGKKHQE